MFEATKEVSFDGTVVKEENIKSNDPWASLVIPLNPLTFVHH